MLEINMMFSEVGWRVPEGAAEGVISLNGGCSGGCDSYLRGYLWNVPLTDCYFEKCRDIGDRKHGN